MPKRRAQTKSTQVKKTKTIATSVCGPIVFFHSRHSKTLMLKQIWDERNFGFWSIGQYGLLLDPTKTITPSCLRSNERVLRYFENGTSMSGLFGPAFACSYHYQISDEFSFSCQNEYCDNVVVFDWGKITSILIEQVAETTSIRVPELLFLVALYASPLHIFIPRDIDESLSLNWIQRSWFIGSPEKNQDDLQRLVANRVQCRAYCDFIGSNGISRMCDYNNFEYDLNYDYDEAGRFELFLHVVQNRRLVSDWLFKHFPVTMFL